MRSEPTLTFASPSSSRRSLTPPERSGYLGCCRVNPCWRTDAASLIDDRSAYKAYSWSPMVDGVVPTLRSKDTVSNPRRATTAQKTVQKTSLAPQTRKRDGTGGGARGIREGKFRTEYLGASFQNRSSVSSGGSRRAGPVGCSSSSRSQSGIGITGVTRPSPSGGGGSKIEALPSERSESVSSSWPNAPPKFPICTRSVCGVETEDL